MTDFKVENNSTVLTSVWFFLLVQQEKEKKSPLGCYQGGTGNFFRSVMFSNKVIAFLFFMCEQSRS